MTAGLRHPLLAATIAIAALLLAAPFSSAARPRAAHIDRRPAIVHTGLAGARSLGKRNRCAARISRVRARPLSTRHSLTVRSELAEATVCPSGLNLTPHTLAV